MKNKEMTTDNDRMKEQGKKTIEPTIPTSPSYPPYGYDMSGEPVNLAYVYPVSPQFSVQYYPDYASYPGSPSLSPSMNPTSPPFSPTFQYQLSPSTYMLPHSAHHFPPLHLASPVLNPTSPPHYFVSPDYRNRRREETYHTHNIYVRGLPSSTTDESFLEICQAYGSVSSSKAMLDPKTGECKGYGFAMFEDEKESEEAIEGLNAAGYQATFAKAGQESFSSRLKHLQDETSTNIYISNLPLDFNERTLEQLFLPYETVSSRILRDPQSGMSRGVGFARMLEREAASAIIEKFNGQHITGSSVPLQVRFADSPAQKRLKNQSTHQRVLRSTPQAGFAVRPMMPITPETMLGFAPPPYYTEHPIQ
ncbi:unnamed protein product [Rhizopus stolonifer]